MDSATIYKDMDIGTAKPSAAERAHIPHHLLDVRDPAQSYDVATFVDDCIQQVKAIQARGHQAVICGGTMRSEEHTSELQSRGHLVCRLLLEKKKTKHKTKKTHTASIG